MTEKTLLDVLKAARDDAILLQAICSMSDEQRVEYDERINDVKAHIARLEQEPVEVIILQDNIRTNNPAVVESFIRDKWRYRSPDIAEVIKMANIEYNVAQHYTPLSKFVAEAVVKYLEKVEPVLHFEDK
jgi:hypothetical protein